MSELVRGRYRIEELLGRGAMSDVYRAFDLRRQVSVAIKFLREDLVEDPEFMARFAREAEALARLDHPNVVRFYSFEREGSRAFLLMDYIEGETLRRRLAERGGPLPLGEVTHILRQVGAALQYAHREGVVHRDIKPGNILIDRHGRVYVNDFGIAKVVEGATMATLGVGTPAYMSPEQILGREIDHRSDIYSLGVVLYEMLTGRRPFTGEEEGLSGASTLERVREAHIRKAVPDPRCWNLALSQAMVEVVWKALAKEPGERWGDVLEMVRAWERAVGVEEGAVFPPAPVAVSSAVPSVWGRVSAWIRQWAPASYIVPAIVLVMLMWLPLSLAFRRNAEQDNDLQATVEAAAQAIAQAIITQQAREAENALATSYVRQRETIQARQTAEAAATRMAGLTRQARQTADARRTATAIAQQMTRQVEETIQARQTAEAAATQIAELTRQARPRCFVARQRHWEKSTSGMGEIGGIIYDWNKRPVTNVLVRLSIAESSWKTDIPVTANGMYNFCCLNLNPHNRHIVELVGGNVRTVGKYEFYINGIDQTRVLVDFYQVDCP